MTKIAWMIDKNVGTVLSAILGGFNKLWPLKNKALINPKKIVIIKLWALGESILTLPLIKSIKQKYPESKISIIARNNNAHVYENLDFIDEIILFEPRNLLKFPKLLKKFDLSFDCEPYLKLSGLISWFCSKNRIGFSHTIRSWLYTHKIDFNDQQHEVLSYMAMAKVLGINEEPKELVKLFYSERDRLSVDSVLEKNNIQKNDLTIGFCVGSAESSKQRIWPAEHFAKLADKLIEEKNAKILFVGSPNESSHIEYIRSLMKNYSINLAGKTSKKALFYLVTKCNLFISNDTGPMHVAAAQGVKTIGLFGPNLPVRFGPFGKNTIAIEKYLPCRPCINVHKGQLPKCKQRKRLGEGYCMQLISVDDVFNEAEKMI